MQNSLYLYTQENGRVGYWNSRLGRTVEGSESKVLNAVRHEFHISSLQHIPPKPELVEAFCAMRWYEAPEDGRLIAPISYVLQQPALAQFTQSLESTTDRAKLMSTRVKLLTTLQAYQRLHHDGETTKGVSM